MQTADNEIKNAFTPGKNYQFDPPVKATGFPTDGKIIGEPQILDFIAGWCIGYSAKFGAYIFQGQPKNALPHIRKKQYYFHVEPGHGSIATEVPK